MNKGRWDGRALLSEQAAEQMQTPQGVIPESEVSPLLRDRVSRAGAQHLRPRVLHHHLPRPQAGLAQRQPRRLQPALLVPAAREAGRARPDQPLGQPPRAGLRDPQRLRPPARRRADRLGRAVQGAGPEGRIPGAPQPGARPRPHARPGRILRTPWPSIAAPTRTRPTARSRSRPPATGSAWPGAGDRPRSCITTTTSSRPTSTRMHRTTIPCRRSA